MGDREGRFRGGGTGGNIGFWEYIMGKRDGKSKHVLGKC